MQHITQNGINLIKHFEGFEPKIYLDAAGLPTIGYGHLLHYGEDEMFKNGITPKAGVALLIKDILSAEQAVLRLIRVPLTDGHRCLGILHLQSRLQHSPALHSPP